MKKLDSELLRAHKGKSFVGVSTAAAICNRNGQIFMAQRSKNARDEHGMWDVCGGGLKFGIKIEDNLRREMNEEFAVVSQETLHPIGVREAFRTDHLGDSTHWIVLDYVIVLRDEEAQAVKINEPDMFDDCGWFDFDALPSPLHSVIDEALMKKVQNKAQQVVSYYGAVDKA